MEYSYHLYHFYAHSLIVSIIRNNINPFTYDGTASGVRHQGSWICIQGGYHTSPVRRKIKAFQKDLLNYPASRLTEQHRQMSTEPGGNYCIWIKNGLHFFLRWEYFTVEKWKLYLYTRAENTIFPDSFLVQVCAHGFICEKGNPFSNFHSKRLTV